MAGEKFLLPFFLKFKFFLTGVIISIIGVILITQPWYDKSSPEVNPTNETLINSTAVPTFHQPKPYSHTFEDDFLGYVLVIIAGVTFSLAQITHKVKLILNFYGGIIATTIPLILSLSTENMAFPSGTFLDNNLPRVVLFIISHGLV